MNYIYLINVITWILIFTAIGIFVHKKLGVLGFTISMGGAFLIFLTILQDAYGYGPSFLTMFPFNASIPILNIINPVFLTTVFVILSFATMFLIEREFYRSRI